MTEKRLHDRFPVLPENVATLTVGRTTLPIKDLSYGGMMVKGIPEGAESTELTHQGTLLLLGEQSPVKFKVAYYTKNSAGLTFVHDSPTTLLFLRGPLEYMKAGATLAPVSAEMLHERYKSLTGRVYRGDLQCDVLAVDGKIADTTKLVVSFRMGEQHKQVVLQGNRMSTGLITKPEQLIPTAADIELDDQPDHYTVRIAAAILVGAVAKVSDALIEGGLAALIERLNRQIFSPDLQKTPITD